MSNFVSYSCVLIVTIRLAATLTLEAATGAGATACVFAVAFCVGAELADGDGVAAAFGLGAVGAG